MSIRLINDSCVEQNVDAIVNAANKYLLGGSGVCGAIFNKAGYEELTNACSKISTPLNDGDAVITPSFNISNCQYIIHAVGPNFSITPEAYDKLFDAYYNSLIVLKEHELHSIAFPLISSGVYGCSLEKPAKVSAEACLNAYNKFISDYDYDIELTLCAYSKKDIDEASEVFNN